MKRWNIIKSCETENEKIDEFLAEVIEVSRKHGLSLGHEDGHGVFLVHKFSQDNVEWLMHAADETDIT